MIDLTRPVRGQDVEDLREKLGLSMSDMIWMLGITPNRWSDITRDDAKLKPLEQTMAPIAIFTRLLDAHPEYCIVPKMPSARDIFDRLTAIDPELNMKEVSLLLGRESSSCFQWLQCGRKFSPQVARLGNMIMKMMDDDKSGGRSALAKLAHHVKIESSARGVTDLSKNGSWGIKDPGSNRRGRRPKVKKELSESASA